MDMELEGRARVAAAEAEKSAAAASGALAAMHMAEQAAVLDARLDAMKQKLYFPPAKGYRSVSWPAPIRAHT